MEILKTMGLKKYYGSGENVVKAVNNINFSVEEGEFVAIVGTSGSGKSTLLHLLGGLDSPTEGEVIIDKKSIYKMDKDSLAIFRRRKIGFIFQQFNLVPVLNAYENIVLPVRLDNDNVDKEYVDEIISLLNLEKRRYHSPNALSGGQQQRVAIARALATKPSIIFADEPTGNLDSKTGEEVLGLLKKSIKKYNQTLLMITHDENIALAADRVIRIEDGRIVK
ncbi:ABC transporter ATP-binding protein [Clostridium sporogenes]|uniref:ABC transporter ATP-binding protein n=2 Tax=Clostridium TaxID=1485 RepID=A0AAE4Z8I8_CLOSG|nr:MULTISPECIES: ABC transporter ATP-binding protein [Clostridium]EKS4342104.1 ABC transporter ATP-binding protein [Clostridium botulinum]MBE6076527.1 ABC transporter ATP-binding protein [Clostridium lundense]EDU37490.1 ABC transporter, ATP-binding protein [Clostridium sporogenes ATCC 15579]EKS4393571.1 ABC transporter ATP-binding protein [Clostridium botulinum]KIS23309.1 ABC transporter ATP-binding protein [Clostridium botulinum B2 450]